MAIFRYPGGKRKLAKLFLEQSGKVGTLAEPFVGGGSVFLHYLKHDAARKVKINDKDPWIYALWWVLFEGSDVQFQALLDKVAVPPTLRLFKELRKTVPATIVDQAYYGLFFNRTTFSGIQTSGPIGGEHQSGKWTVDCRYKADRLLKEMREIRETYKGRVTVTNLDFKPFLLSLDPTDFIYADPPYYLKGGALYPEQMNDADHVELSLVLKRLPNRTLLSYDDHPRVRELYTEDEIMSIDALYTINGKKSANKKTQELLIWIHR